MKLASQANCAAASIRRYAGVAGVVWTLIIAVSLTWNVYNEYHHVVVMANIATIASVNKDIAVRQWATARGGVYVSPDAHTPPNPYLAHVPDRDVITTSGKQLTLLNPAYMLRQIQSQAADQEGVSTRITSLKPLNPINAPDTWETQALRQIAEGAELVSERTEITGKPYLRTMLPFTTEAGCLKCHAQQGYQVGDVRGGVAVSTALKPYLASAKSSVMVLGLTHLLIWLCGLSALSWIVRRTMQRAQEREHLERQLQQHREHLEALVASRTADLEQEITTRKQTEAALSRSNTLLQAVIKQAPFAVHVLDGDYNQIRVIIENDESRRIMGERLEGRDNINAEKPETLVTRFFTVDGRQEVPLAQMPSPRAFRGEIVSHEDFLFRHPNGTEIIVEANASPVYDDNQRLIAIVVTFHDITARTQAEEALRASEEKYRLLTEYSSDVIWTLDLNGKFTYVSPSVFRLRGFTPEEVLQQPMEQVVCPGSRAAVQAGFRLAFESIATGHDAKEPTYFEIEQPCRDGTTVWTEATAHLMYNAAGQPISLVGMSRDITARKQTEEQIKQHLNELRAWHTVALNREERILVLKQEINELLHRLANLPAITSRTARRTSAPNSTRGRTRRARCKMTGFRRKSCKNGKSRSM